MDNDLMLEQLYDQLISNLRIYHPAANQNGMIRKAFEVAKAAHAGQVRKSGEPFVIHPIKVAIILSELHLDKETIIAALLHDVVEDTSYTKEDIQNEFGEEVMFLVDGVTKLSKMSDHVSKAEMKLESFRKLMMATATDIRVIIIKLADRLHNMQTLQFQKPEKQLEIAAETLDIYSPIAQRLGISVLSMELEDLSFSYLFPEEYKNISQRLSGFKIDRKMNMVLSEINRELSESGFHFRLRYERKHLFSIYRKMINRGKTLDELYDIAALKVSVGSVGDCYSILGILHNLYKPIPNRMKDYIALPKENMYQSLHTTLVSKGGSRFEVQIKTKEMDQVARYGILAHWKYGESNETAREISRSQWKKSMWLKRILEWQQDITNNAEFIDLVKGDFDLFSETISCFTPKGDVKRLQKGSTLVDFAYAIHSDIGNKMIGAYVNRAKKEPDYVLQNGDFVEIVTAENEGGPRREWLNFVKTGNAKNQIKKFFRGRQQYELEAAQEMIEKESDEKQDVVAKIKVFLHKTPGVEKLRPITLYILSKKIHIASFAYEEKDAMLEVFFSLGSAEEAEQVLREIAMLQYVERVKRF